ncbi:MAG: hypothetical protein DLM60_04585 [Pseudonocardiales bacterium]|nr:MAG: hypothetical protein DLM60_04585 [Pseudonocardiales bacterium]
MLFLYGFQRLQNHPLLSLELHPRRPNPAPRTPRSSEGRRSHRPSRFQSRRISPNVRDPTNTTSRSATCG